jgi:hypothetical protein
LLRRAVDEQVRDRQRRALPWYLGGDDEAVHVRPVPDVTNSHDAAVVGYGGGVDRRGEPLLPMRDCTKSANCFVKASSLKMRFLSTSEPQKTKP